MTQRTKERMIFLFVAAAAFASDYSTKQAVLEFLSPGETVPLLGEVLSLTLVFNPGALWSIDPSALIPWLSSRTFFVVFGILALTVLFFFVRSLRRKEHPFLFWGSSFVMGGALGNLTDRFIQDQGVVDFIRFDLGFAPFNPWPIFNFADIWLTTGIICMIVGTIRGEDADGKKKAA
ncbi:MAG: signal peptidase II [Fibrobacterota bacterium]